MCDARLIIICELDSRGSISVILLKVLTEKKHMQVLYYFIKLNLFSYSIIHFKISFYFIIVLAYALAN